MQISQSLSILLASIFLMLSCGQNEQRSDVSSEEVLIKLPVFLSLKFETSDIVAFAQGKNGTKFGAKVDQVNKIPGISIDKKELIRSLKEPLPLNKEAVAVADQSAKGRKLLADFSTYVHSGDKKGDYKDSLIALKISAEDGSGSILELIQVWPSKRVDVNILKIITNESDFQRILDGLNELNEG